MILRVRPEGRVGWTHLCEPTVTPSADEPLHRTVQRVYRDELNNHPLRAGGEVVLEFELIDDEGGRSYGALEPGDYFDHEGDMVRGEQTQAANRQDLLTRVMGPVIEGIVQKAVEELAKSSQTAAEAMRKMGIAVEEVDVDSEGPAWSGTLQSLVEAEHRLRELDVTIEGVTYTGREVVRAVDNHVDPTYIHEIEFARPVGETLEEFNASCAKALDQLRRRVLDHRAQQQNSGGPITELTDEAKQLSGRAGIHRQEIKRAVETVRARNSNWRNDWVHVGGKGAPGTVEDLENAPLLDQCMHVEADEPFDAADAIFPDPPDPAQLSYLPDGSAPVQPGDVSAEGVVSSESYERAMRKVNDHRSDALPYLDPRTAYIPKTLRVPIVFPAGSKVEFEEREIGRTVDPSTNYDEWIEHQPEHIQRAIAGDDEDG